MAILPDFSQATFTPGQVIDNPYFPLISGTVLSYTGEEIDPDTGEVSVERNDLQTTAATHEVRGVETTVIRDTVYVDDLLHEETFDYYAQDDAGNVWYFGELTFTYEFDDAGAFLGVAHGGEWNADLAGQEPGILMRAEQTFGPAWYEEFAPGVAEDESILAETGLTVVGPLGTYENVINVLDSSALNPNGIEYKFYAPGVGEIVEQKINPDGSIGVTVELTRVDTGKAADATDADDAAMALNGLAEGETVEHTEQVQDVQAADFAGTGGPRTVTYVGGRTDSVDALGAWTYDAATGEIGPAQILIADLKDAGPGASVEVEVPAGQVLCLFLVRGVDGLGIDIADYVGGGLQLTNLLEGGPANMNDVYTPHMTDALGNVLPIQPLAALGGDDDQNLLNPAGSLNAITLGSSAPGAAGLTLVGFEDRMDTSTEWDGDFNDAVVAVSDAPLGAQTLRALRFEARGGTVGTGGDDSMSGDGGEDLLAGLGGNDRVAGAGGDDDLLGNQGNDRLSGGNGEDQLFGGAGDDRLTGGAEADEFTFRRGEAGQDTVLDFEADEGDQILLLGFRASFGFDDLDSNGDGFVGAGDALVGIGADGLTLDTGAGSVLIADVMSLEASAFAFVG